jgi:hypothetical protein
MQTAVGRGFTFACFYVILCLLIDGKRKNYVMARTVGIGYQDFGKFIENGGFYIDKTLFIKEWWESRDEVTLITRPRRFGKTLTLNMTEYFFSLSHAGRSDLFENLSVWQEETYRNLQGTYPVISFSFANVKESDYDNVRKKCARFWRIYMWTINICSIVMH